MIRFQVERGTPLDPANIAAAIGAVWLVAALLVAADAPFSVDGYVYHAMADAFAKNGALFVENGYKTYGSEALQPLLVNVVGDRLAPQYPGGWGIVAAPAYALGGLRGVIFLNAIASVATIYAVWVAAQALFDDRRLAGHAALIYAGATFAVDYAFGVWPHAATTFCVAAALAALAVGWRRGDELRGTLIAGLVLGLGVNFRVDALFAVAPIAAWLLLAGRRPYRALGLLALGLLPGLVAASFINWLKFGIAFPITYGREGGTVSLGYYAGLLPFAGAACLSALALGLPQARALVFRPQMLVLCCLALAALIVAVPAVGATFLRIAEGSWTLLVDMQSIDSANRGVSVQPDGTVLVFGLFKKALIQSMPYLAGLIVLLPALGRGEDRAALGLCFLFIAITILPFAYAEWHGGKSNNMRYFLNLVPVLAVLAAVAFRETCRRALAGVTSVSPLVALAIVLAGVAAPMALGRPVAYIGQVSLPNALAVAATITALLALSPLQRFRTPAAQALRQTMLLGMACAVISAWVIDLAISQSTRDRNARIAALMEDVPANALVAVFAPEVTAMRLNRPPALTSQADFVTGSVSPALRALVATAFAEGRPVIVQSDILAMQLIEQGAAADAQARYDLEDSFAELYDLSPPISGAEAAQ
ncbi:MAG: glycosyltransferase family 39 protein [Pseudomonadota bacterium]